MFSRSFLAPKMIGCREPSLSLLAGLPRSPFKMGSPIANRIDNCRQIFDKWSLGADRDGRPVDGSGECRKVEAESAAALRALRPAVFSGAGGVVVVPDGLFYDFRGDVMALVNEAKLPAIYPEREYADDGGLMEGIASVVI